MWRKRQMIKKRHKFLLNMLSHKLFKALSEGELDIVIPDINLKSYDKVSRIFTYDITPIVIRPEFSEIIATCKEALLKELILKQEY